MHWRDDMFDLSNHQFPGALVMSVINSRSCVTVIAIGAMFFVFNANYGPAKTPPPSAKNVTAEEPRPDADPAFEQARATYAKQMAEIERAASALVEEAVREARLKADELKKAKTKP